MSDQAPFPHCNSEVLHAPGTCGYCDEYPDRQAMRTASNTPFTPAEANGWGGNVAQPLDADVPLYINHHRNAKPIDLGRPSLRQRLRDLIGLP